MRIKGCNANLCYDQGLDILFSQTCSYHPPNLLPGPYETHLNILHSVLDWLILPQISKTFPRYLLKDKMTAVRSNPQYRYSGCRLLIYPLDNGYGRKQSHQSRVPLRSKLRFALLFSGKVYRVPLIFLRTEVHLTASLPVAPTGGEHGRAV